MKILRLLLAFVFAVAIYGNAQTRLTSPLTFSSDPVKQGSLANLGLAGVQKSGTGATILTPGTMASLADLSSTLSAILSSGTFTGTVSAVAMRVTGTASGTSGIVISSTSPGSLSVVSPGGTLKLGDNNSLVWDGSSGLALGAGIVSLDSGNWLRLFRYDTSTMVILSGSVPGNLIVAKQIFSTAYGVLRLEQSDASTISLFTGTSGTTSGTFRGNLRGQNISSPGNLSISATASGAGVAITGTSGVQVSAGNAEADAILLHAPSGGVTLDTPTVTATGDMVAAGAVCAPNGVRMVDPEYSYDFSSIVASGRNFRFYDGAGEPAGVHASGISFPGGAPTPYDEGAVRIYAGYDKLFIRVADDGGVPRYFTINLSGTAATRTINYSGTTRPDPY